MWKWQIEKVRRKMHWYSSSSSNSNIAVNATDIIETSATAIAAMATTTTTTTVTTMPTWMALNELPLSIEIEIAMPLLPLLNKSKNKQVALYFHNYTIFSRSSYWHLHLILCVHVLLYRPDCAQEGHNNKIILKSWNIRRAVVCACMRARMCAFVVNGCRRLFKRYKILYIRASSELKKTKTDCDVMWYVRATMYGEHTLVYIYVCVWVWRALRILIGSVRQTIAR